MISAPAAVKKSALPDLLEIALLPCFVIEAPPAAATKEDAVEQLKVCKPVPPVPHVSICVPSPISNFKDLALITEAAAVISSSLIPFSFREMRKISISLSSTSPVIILSTASCISSDRRSFLSFNFLRISLIIGLKSFL